MFLNDCLHRIYGGIGPKQRNQMKTAVLAAYEQAGSDLPSLPDVLAAYETVVGERIDAPYSILSYLADLEVFVPDARDAVSFRQFFDGVLVIDLASLGIGEKERNMLVVLFLRVHEKFGETAVYWRCATAAIH
jgi:DNA phosphorothioation-dependent restriction protein DptH